MIQRVYSIGTCHISVSFTSLKTFPDYRKEERRWSGNLILYTTLSELTPFIKLNRKQQWTHCSVLIAHNWRKWREVS